VAGTFCPSPSWGHSVPTLLAQIALSPTLGLRVLVLKINIHQSKSKTSKFKTFSQLYSFSHVIPTLLTAPAPAPMPKAPAGYRPLLHRGSRGSLWLADDHLLVIESTRFLLCIRETYRRLDFHNIQAILHAKSPRGTWITALCILFLCISLALLAWSASDDTPFALFSAALIGLPSLAALIAHLIMGETRSLAIQTTVHPWRLRMVTRRKHVQKILAALEHLCRSSQQEIALALGTTNPPASPTSLPPPLAPPAIAQNIHPLALPAWLCFLAYACMMGGELLWNSLAATIVMLALGSVFFTLLMIAFTRGKGTIAVGGRFVFSFSLIMLGISIVAGYAAGMGVMMKSAFTRQTPDLSSQLSTETAMIRAIAAFPDGLSHTLVTIAASIVALTIASALAGLIATFRLMKLQRDHTPPPHAPTP